MAPKRRPRPVVLVVVDGFGFREQQHGNGVAMARMPNWKGVWAKTPRALLAASGLPVGLPADQMGNSEVGHLNLGAGRVVPQDLVRIDAAIADQSFYRIPAFTKVCAKIKSKGGTLHLMGLIGDGGVHARDQHLFTLIKLAHEAGVARIAIHCLMDGRDTLPMSGMRYMQELLQQASGKAFIASVGGRYFGMDRDNRWERVKRWYDAAVLGVGHTATDPIAAIKASYDRGVTDEFIAPVVLTHGGAPVAPMRDGDAVVTFNYRSDRMRQIVRALMSPKFDGFEVSTRPKLSLATMTSYDEKFSFPVAFPPFAMTRIVAEVVSDAKLTMFRTAETEKYPHVTYFFNGGIETPYAGEVRNLVPSPKVATYDMKPEMSAVGVTDVLCESIAAGSYDFTLCNYANADMVGHTGSIPAVIRALECVDECLGRVMAAAAAAGARLILTSDHGNCEVMIDPGSGGPHTAHTTNPVPFVILDPEGDRPLRATGGALCDVGPTVLAMLGVKQPKEMTGRDLRLPA